MATLCKNCGGSLVFNPGKNKMFCKMCGTYFSVSDVDIKDREILETQKAVSAQKVYGSDDKSFMDCNIYTCNHCGGEIIINNTEVSTYCIYCGNPAVVFSRVAKQRRPEFILPFSVTREDAIDIMRMRLNNAFFVPKEIKEFKPDAVRGIYIPYWIVNASHHNAAFLSGQVKQGKNTVTKYYERVGECDFKNMTLDASRTLSDFITEKLEPFDLTALKPFDENYLAGFYSDMNDLSEQEIVNSANRRCDEMFREEVIRDVHARSVKVIDSAPYTQLNEDKIYAMLPAWFITIEYNGSPLTILINGDTGKLVGTFPFDKKKFITLTAVQSVLLSAVFITLAYAFISAMCFNFTRHHGGDLASDLMRIFIYIAAAVGAVLIGVVNRIKKFRRNLQLTMSRQTLKYVKRRQG